MVDQEPLEINVFLGFLVVSSMANLVGTFYIALNLLKKVRVVAVAATMLTPVENIDV